MNKLTKVILVLVVLAIIIGGFWYATYKKPSPVVVVKEPIKIGAILPLSGGSVALGENAKNGIEMAIKELGGDNYSVIYEDDQFDSKKTVSALNKLINVDKVKYVITLGSNTSNAAGPVAQDEKVVHIAISTDPKVLNYGFSVKNASDPKELGKVMAQEAVRRDYKKIYILSTNHEGVLSIVNEFKNQEDIKDRIIGEELFNPDETDYKTGLTKAMAQKPDAILLEIIPGKVGLAAKQAKELNAGVPLFAGVVFEDQNAINAAGGSLEGQWYANSAVSDAFVEKYKNIYNSVPSREAGNGYDSIALIKQAVEAVGDDAIKVNDYLHQLTEFNSGSILNGIKAENGNFINYAIVKMIKDNKFVPYSEN